MAKKKANESVQDDVKKEDVEVKNKTENTTKKTNNTANKNNNKKATTNSKKTTKSKKNSVSKNEPKNESQNDSKDNKVEEKSTDVKQKKSNNKNSETKNENKEIKENKKVDKEKKVKEKPKEKSKALVDTSKKPDYINELIRRRKVKLVISILVTILIVFLIVFSFIFSLVNLNNENIVEGISIKGIDVSKITIDDARKGLKEKLDKELTADVILKYHDFEIALNPSDIEFKYDLNNAVENAYTIGRTNRIIADNYAILFTSIFGKDVDLEYEYNDELLTDFIKNINVELPGVVVSPSFYIEGDKLYVVPGKDGVAIQVDEMKKAVLTAIVSRNYSEINDGYKQIVDISVDNMKADLIDMLKMYDDIYSEPKDAYYTTEPYNIFTDVDGVDLVISKEEAQKEIEKEVKDEYVFDLKLTKANKTIYDLGMEAFPCVISSFTTKYDASNTNRSTNLKIAAGKINGKVLMPGEEFSYNQVVGKRTVEEGYKDAKIYADGGVVDGLAGGICQISSTLYNAVLLANLEVTERTNHTYTTSYLPAGRDATVVWGVKDFKFKNNRPYPIKIESSVSNGVAKFDIHGIEENEYDVRILPVQTGSIGFGVAYQENPALAPGQQVVAQAGHTGYRVRTTKEVRLKSTGELISSEVISNDTYEPMTKIIQVGPGTPIQ